MMEWAAILNVVWSIAKACGIGIELTVDPDVSQVMAVETCFIITEMIWGQRGLPEITSPVSFTPLYSL